MRILHGGDYAGPSYCGIPDPRERDGEAPLQFGFSLFFHQDEDGIHHIMGYRSFAKLCVEGAPKDYKLCEKCSQSPDMALHVLAHLERD